MSDSRRVQDAYADHGLPPAKRQRQQPDDFILGQGGLSQSLDQQQQQYDYGDLFWATDETSRNDVDRYGHQLDEHGQFTPTASVDFAPKELDNVTTAQNPRLVCFGMIPNISCQRLSTSSGLSEESVFMNEPEVPYMRLDLIHKRGRVIIGTKDVPELIQTNSKATLVLLEALRMSGVQIQVYVNRDQLSSFLRDGVKTKRLGRLLVDANVIGPETAGEKIGKEFSDHGIYLQDPKLLDLDFIYENPQLLKLDDNVDQSEEVLFNLLFPDFVVDDISTGNDSAWSLLPSDLSQHVLSAVSVTVDVAIVTTPVMLHQGQALDFMCKRESDQAFLEDDMRFWVYDRTDSGAPIYRHRVTFEEQRYQPIEPKGGILADEMGLGKTLTTLSLIVASRDRALDFEQAYVSATESPLPHSRATLVVVPSTQIMDSWEEQLRKHTCENRLKVSRYHGHERSKYWEELREHDIVLTTFGTIARESRKSSREVLYYMKFYRIVLDEAHIIRTRNTKLFAAIYKLHAANHWCLTGTPISNKIEDLGTLLQFCRVPILGEAKLFQKHVAVPVKKAARRNCSALRETLKPICLRRTKALLDLPEPEAVQILVTFSPAEKAQYDQILRMGKAAIDDALSGRNGKTCRNTMLKILLRLRIFCNQGTFMPLQITDTEVPLDADEHHTLLEETDEAFCGVCFSPITGINQADDSSSGVLTTCSHVVCKACRDELTDQLTATSPHTCPICEESSSLSSTAESHDRNALPQPTPGHSSKLDALIQDLLRTQNAERPEKSIVFSSWRKTIGIAARLCEQNGIRALQIDGTTPHAARSSILQRFIEDKSISTLLMTIGTGGLGLTITAASRVHILDPQWNPSVEDQAIGRVVRLGQEKPTTVVRYLVKDSVEQHVQSYQRRKLKLAAGGFDHRVDMSIPKEHVRLDAAYIAQSQT